MFIYCLSFELIQFFLFQKCDFSAQQYLAKVVMIPISTNKICELLKEFYCKVSYFSDRYSEKQQQLQSILLKFQQINLFDQKFDIQNQKTSQTTQQSIQIVNEKQNTPKYNKKVQNNLFFTFNIKYEQQTKCEQENICFKYSNKSLSKIIIFSVFFNHHYITKVVEKSRIRVASIVNHDRRIVLLLKSSLKRLKQNRLAQKNSNSSQVCDLLEKYLDNNDDCSLQFLTEDLKYFINNLDEDITNSFIQILVQRKKNSAFDDDNFLRKSQQPQNQQQLLLSYLSQRMKIKFVLQQRKLKFQWGSSKSSLSLTIRKSQSKKQFSLKEMSYYTTNDLINSDSLTNNIKKIHNF